MLRPQLAELANGNRMFIFNFVLRVAVTVVDS